MRLIEILKSNPIIVTGVIWHLLKDTHSTQITNWMVYLLLLSSKKTDVEEINVIMSIVLERVETICFDRSILRKFAEMLRINYQKDKQIDNLLALSIQCDSFFLFTILIDKFKTLNSLMDSLNGGGTLYTLIHDLPAFMHFSDIQQVAFIDIITRRLGWNINAFIRMQFIVTMASKVDVMVDDIISNLDETEFELFQINHFKFIRNIITKYHLVAIFFNIGHISNMDHATWFIYHDILMDIFNRRTLIRGRIVYGAPGSAVYTWCGQFGTIERLRSFLSYLDFTDLEDHTYTYCNCFGNSCRCNTDCNQMDTVLWRTPLLTFHTKTQEAYKEIPFNERRRTCTPIKLAVGIFRHLLHNIMPFIGVPVVVPVVDGDVAVVDGGDAGDGDY
jgi:hypothetical protein